METCKKMKDIKLVISESPSSFLPDRQYAEPVMNQHYSLAAEFSALPSRHHLSKEQTNVKGMLSQLFLTHWHLRTVLLKFHW